MDEELGELMGPQPANDASVERLEQQVDERDETIRLLNEELSSALDEIERLAPRVAA
jgi:hypothetical protein